MGINERQPRAIRIVPKVAQPGIPGADVSEQQTVPHPRTLQDQIEEMGRTGRVPRSLRIFKADSF